MDKGTASSTHDRDSAAGGHDPLTAHSTWEPSWWGKTMLGVPTWKLELYDDRAIYTQKAAPPQTLTIETLREFTTRPGWWWSTVLWPDLRVPLAGIPKERGEALKAAVDRQVTESDHLAELTKAFHEGAPGLQQWWSMIAPDRQAFAARWLPRDIVERWIETKPPLANVFFESLEDPRLNGLIRAQPGGFLQAAEWWKSDIAARARRHNEQVLVEEPVRLAQFFQLVEKTPLTAEQVRAVVCFDNRVQVVASAGSGKTSTMIAKAGYALERGVTTPDRILMLVFNKKAAKEMRQRIDDRLGDKGKDVSARTFHAFGLDVIGQATGRRPSLSETAKADGGIPEIAHVIETLSRRDATFAASWNLFRLVFAEELPPFESMTEAEAVLQTANESGLLTRAGEVVKSQEERMIADWLYYNNVDYKYEPSYEHDTADGQHRQYRPDFYYPSIKLYHEHFALNARGEAPPTFRRYLEGVQWKRNEHAKWGTDLVETTSATIRDGSGFMHLQRELEARGVTLKPELRPEVQIQHLAKDRTLLGLVRTFLSHSKASRLDDAALVERVTQTSASPVRARLFLRFFLPIRTEWDDRLVKSGCVDFDDMINLAADLIAAGAWDSPYDLVMVDEFQDTSAARASLVQALVSRRNRYLFTVGDDWQSINRFAGADLSVMTRFHQWFGAAETVKLERTFRSPQAICDIAGAFVAKNPNQLDKHVASQQQPYAPAVRVVAVNTSTDYPKVIDQHLTALNQAHSEHPARSSTSKGATEQSTVLILGRYQRTRDSLEDLLKRSWPHLHVEYSTMHSSKGREADHVILADLVAGRFPSTRMDDPILSVAMPHPDTYPNADERRLFYVALTRTRRSLLLLTVLYKESPFLLELVSDKHITLQAPDGTPARVVFCPRCGGRMKRRTNKRNGEFFWGCAGWKRDGTGCSGSRNDREN